MLSHVATTDGARRANCRNVPRSRLSDPKLQMDDLQPWRWQHGEVSRFGGWGAGCGVLDGEITAIESPLAALRRANNQRYRDVRISADVGFTNRGQERAPLRPREPLEAQPDPPRLFCRSGFLQQPRVARLRRRASAYLAAPERRTRAPNRTTTEQIGGGLGIAPARRRRRRRSVPNVHALTNRTTAPPAAHRPVVRHLHAAPVAARRHSVRDEDARATAPPRRCRHRPSPSARSAAASPTTPAARRAG